MKSPPRHESNYSSQIIRKLVHNNNNNNNYLHICLKDGLTLGPWLLDLTFIYLVMAHKRYHILNLIVFMHSVFITKQIIKKHILKF